MSKQFKISLMVLLLLVLAFSVFQFVASPLGAGQTQDPLASSPVNSMAPPSEAPPATAIPPGTDPFKKFLENKAANPSAPAPVSVAPQTNETAPVKGVDPFKAFLDKQKQQGKEQVVSPFGSK